MATKTKSIRKPLPSSTITPQDIRHFVGDMEVATIPEMIARMGGTTKASVRGDYVYNTLHAGRTTLLPKPEVYGTAYLYPVEPLREAILKVQESLASKKIEKNSDVKQLLAKIQSNPELVKVLLGLLD
jgi:hypothetical protein